MANPFHLEGVNGSEARMRTIRIGSGAGYGGDRIEPAVDLMRDGALDYICFECLAERTISIAQQQRLRDPEKGYNELLEERFERILPLQAEKGFRVVTNMGAANPLAAARVVADMAGRMGLRGLRIAAVTGDDLLDDIGRFLAQPILETGAPLGSLADSIISANAYIGCGGIVEALKAGADIVIGGRIADPALFLGPLVHEFGWPADRHDLIGRGIVAGHLLECAAQVCGGYFADPGFKDVPELWNVGFPIAEVSEDGTTTVTKLPSAGGMVTTATVKEQLIYEIHDPACYFTPDGIADFTGIRVEETGRDRVRVTGADGREGNGLYKVSVGCRDSFIGEGEISYGGPGALARARLAAEILKRRFEATGLAAEETRFDLMGVNSLHADAIPARCGASEPHEVRLRCAARTRTRAEAVRVGNEVEALYTNGPAAGGGVTKGVREIVSVASIFVPQSEVRVKTTILTV